MILVITIIVMLILAGVTIKIVVGENGILSKVTNAAEKTNYANAVEDVEMAWSSLTTTYYDEKYTNDFNVSKTAIFTKDALNGELQLGRISNYSGYISDGDTTFTYTLASTGKSYEMSIDTLGNVTANSDSGTSDSASDTVTLTQSQYDSILDRLSELENNSSVATVNDQYSTEEQIVGKWVDGENIYRQVINISENILVSNSMGYIVKVEIDNVDSLIDSGGYVIVDGYKVAFGSSEFTNVLAGALTSYAYLTPSNQLGIAIQYNGNCYSDNPLTGSVWVEYTKVTED